jgi:antitoxin HicB
MVSKTVEEYLSLPYHIEVIRETDQEDPGWVAWVKELPGCLTQADKFEELEGMITDAMRGWIDIAIQDGIPIPLPQPDEQFSGKFVVRVPRQLHRQLVEEAGRQNVSLNQYVNYGLAMAIRSAGAELPEPLDQEAFYRLKSSLPHRVSEKSRPRQQPK